MTHLPPFMGVLLGLGILWPGGSILIIGAAAGVAAMGLERIRFFWYAKRISGLALLGYFGGIGVYLAQTRLFS